mgnify:FL=1
MASKLAKEHKQLVAEFNSILQNYCDQHKEVVEEKTLFHREDVAFLEEQIAYLCQGAPQKAKVVQERVRAQGLKRQAQLRADREELLTPRVLPTLPEEAIVDAALKKEAAEDASLGPAKAPPSASASAHEWSPSWK